MEPDKSPLHPTLEEVWGMSGFETVLIGPTLGRFYKLIKSHVHCLQWEKSLADKTFVFYQSSVKTAAYYYKSSLIFLRPTGLYRRKEEWLLNYSTMCMKLYATSQIFNSIQTWHTDNPWNNWLSSVLPVWEFESFGRKTQAYHNHYLFPFSEVFVGVCV